MYQKLFDFMKRDSIMPGILVDLVLSSVYTILYNTRFLFT